MNPITWKLFSEKQKQMETKPNTRPNPEDNASIFQNDAVRANPSGATVQYTVPL